MYAGTTYKTMHIHVHTPRSVALLPHNPLFGEALRAKYFSRLAFYCTTATTYSIVARTCLTYYSISAKGHVASNALLLIKLRKMVVGI